MVNGTLTLRCLVCCRLRAMQWHTIACMEHAKLCRLRETTFAIKIEQTVKNSSYPSLYSIVVVVVVVVLPSDPSAKDYRHERTCIHIHICMKKKKILTQNTWNKRLYAFHSFFHQCIHIEAYSVVHRSARECCARWLRHHYLTIMILSLPFSSCSSCMSPLPQLNACVSQWIWWRYEKLSCRHSHMPQTHTHTHTPTITTLK